MDPRTPVLVGFGQVTNRRPNVAHGRDLMAHAAQLANEDAGGRAFDRVDSVQVVQNISWRHPAPATVLGELLRLRPGERLLSTIGGSTPQWMVNQACDRIVRGEVNGVLVVGCEALDSTRRAEKQGHAYDRGRDHKEKVTPDTVMGDDRSPVCPEELAARLVAPASIYPMFEQALAHAAGRTPDEQRTWLGEVMAPFTKVAATHPDIAWFPAVRSPGELSEITDDNRMVAEPYPKNLNSILNVDMSAAMILMSAEAAEAGGVPRDRWVFPWTGAKCDDVWFLAQRPHFDRSVAVEELGRAVLAAAGISVDDVAHIDLYSCFPSAVQMGANALGVALDDPRGLTVTGGLPYFGGPGNNYVTHSIAMLARRLREDADAIGMATGISWYVTKNAIGIYSATPPANGWQHPDMTNVQARIDATALRVAGDGEGPAIVDAFTVEHDKDEGPVRAPLYATLADGRRVVAVPADQDIPRQLSGRCLIGEKVNIRSGEGGTVYEL